MTTEHQRPLIAFIGVTLLCALVLANGVMFAVRSPVGGDLDSARGIFAALEGQSDAELLPEVVDGVTVVEEPTAPVGTAATTETQLPVIQAIRDVARSTGDRVGGGDARTRSGSGEVRTVPARTGGQSDGRSGASSRGPSRSIADKAGVRKQTSASRSPARRAGDQPGKSGKAGKAGNSGKADRRGKGSQTATGRPRRTLTDGSATPQKSHSGQGGAKAHGGGKAHGGSKAHGGGGKAHGGGKARGGGKAHGKGGSKGRGKGRGRR